MTSVKIMVLITIVVLSTILLSCSQDSNQGAESSTPNEVESCAEKCAGLCRYGSGSCLSECQKGCELEATSGAPP